MNILVACEYSAIVRDSFRVKGHNAWSCDLLPTDGDPKYHRHGDVIEFLSQSTIDWDLIIAHPSCQYVCGSGLHWNKRQPERAIKTDEALKFIEFFWNLPVKKLCIENPVGCINTRLDFMPKPQYIQPYQFGEDASKKTGLWTRGLKPLIATKYCEPRLVEYSGKLVKRWSNQTDSGQNKLAPSVDRWKLRSTTYHGIADAMADQWG